MAVVSSSPCNAQLLTKVDLYRVSGNAVSSASAVASAGMLAVSSTTEAVTITLPLVRLLMYTYGEPFSSPILGDS